MQRLLLTLACLVVIVAGMKAAAGIITLFLLAVFVVIITAPFYLAMVGRRVPSAVALIIMIGALVLLGFGLVSVAGQSLSSFNDNLPSYRQKLTERTDRINVWLDEREIELFDEEMLDVASPQKLMQYIGSAASVFTGLLGKAFVILVVAIFMLLEVAGMPAKFAQLRGGEDSGGAWMHQIVHNVQHYLMMKTVISAVTGVLLGIALWLLGVDYPILLGLSVFLLNFVPNIGSILAAIPAVLLAFIEFGSGRALVVAGLYLAVNVVIGSFLEPRIMGHRLGLSPLVILLSLIFWGWVLGPVGVLLSVPLTLAVRIALEDVEEARGLVVLMGTGKTVEKV